MSQNVQKFQNSGNLVTIFGITISTNMLGIGLAIREIQEFWKNKTMLDVETNGRAKYWPYYNKRMEEMYYLFIKSYISHNFSARGIK